MANKCIIHERECIHCDSCLTELEKSLQKKFETQLTLKSF